MPIGVSTSLLHPIGDNWEMGTKRLIETERRQCRERGVRLTPLREEVLRLVVGRGKPVKAYELLDRLKGARGGAAPPTVYRALDFLLAHGFIHRLESLNAFVSCGDPNAAHDGQFLICDRCEAAVELDDMVLADQVVEAARAKGFRAERQTIEVHGLCRDCAAQDRRESP